MQDQPDIPILDFRAAARFVQRDARLLRELTDLFRGYYPLLVEDLRGAIAMGDEVALRRAARRLANAVSMFPSPATLVWIRRLELRAGGPASDALLDTMNCLEHCLLALLERLDLLAARLHENGRENVHPNREAAAKRNRHGSPLRFDQAVSAEVASAGSSTPSRKPASVRQR